MTSGWPSPSAAAAGALAIVTLINFYFLHMPHGFYAVDNGVELLVHVGIDTVNLGGEGFEVLVSKGDEVTAGQELYRFDRQVIKDAGYPLITPVLVTNTPKYASVEGRPADAVTPGDAVITVTTK